MGIEGGEVEAWLELMITAVAAAYFFCLLLIVFSLYMGDWGKRYNKLTTECICGPPLISKAVAAGSQSFHLVFAVGPRLPLDVFNQTAMQQCLQSVIDIPSGLFGAAVAGAMPGFCKMVFCSHEISMSCLYRTSITVSVKGPLAS